MRRDPLPRSASAIRALVAAPISIAEIDQAHNEEYRRWLIERYGGIERYMRDAGAVPIHGDDYGTLWRRTTRGEPIVAVEVQCPTTGRVYMLRVPPTAATAHEAVAWTFRLPAAMYQPTMES